MPSNLSPRPGDCFVGKTTLLRRSAVRRAGGTIHSSLPEIIRLCNENGIALILARGKTISFVNLPKPPGLDDYMLDLADYLTKNGVRFADLAPDARLGAGDYIDRFHIQPAARGAYTQMLAEALIPLLP